MSTPHAHIEILLLAGGPSTRMGTAKQLLPFRGATLIRHLTSEAVSSKADGVTVVTGSEHESIVREVTSLGVHCVRNQGWKEGIASSIRCGIQSFGESCGACLIMLSDQPHVSREVLDRIITKYRTGNTSLVACSYETTVGVPALFDKTVFPELMALTGDSGAQGILNARLGEVGRVLFPEGSTDIDSREDYQNLIDRQASTS